MNAFKQTEAISLMKNHFDLSCSSFLDKYPEETFKRSRTWNFAMTAGSATPCRPPQIGWGPWGPRGSTRTLTPLASGLTGPGLETEKARDSRRRPPGWRTRSGRWRARRRWAARRRGRRRRSRRWRGRCTGTRWPRCWSRARPTAASLSAGKSSPVLFSKDGFQITETYFPFIFIHFCDLSDSGSHSFSGKKFHRLQKKFIFKVCFCDEVASFSTEVQNFGNAAKVFFLFSFQRTRKLRFQFESNN